ncbi:MAG: methyltransferase domain-containing protein [Pseudonocardiaceae bacterium]
MSYPTDLSPGERELAQARLRELAERFTADGILRTPQWRDVFERTWRHPYVPSFYPTLDGPCLLSIDPRRRDDWLAAVYSDQTLITKVVQVPMSPALRPGSYPVYTSSSTMPSLVLRMLEALDVHDGHWVLEVGTGTGYNAALLSHRLGDRNVCSVDIDPALITAARDRLAQLGYHPTLAARDGAEGLVEHAPFDKIIATCSLCAVPAAWISQLRPGGTALVHIEGPLGAGNLVALHRDADRPGVQGRFLPWWGCFMARRTSAGSTTGSPRPVRTTVPPSTRTTTLDPAQVDGTQMFPFLAQLHLPPGMYRAIRLTDNDTPITYLACPDGSWCEITRTPDATGHYTVREAGPTPLWTGIEAAWAEWRELGAPPWHEFGLTATPTTHHIWHHHPDTGPHWALPTPTW